MIELQESFSKLVRETQVKNMIPKRLAILIGNSEYHGVKHYKNLPGVKRDIKNLENFLQKSNYKVRKIEDSKQIIEDVRILMSNLPEGEMANYERVLLLFGGIKLHTIKIL